MSNNRDNDPKWTKYSDHFRKEVLPHIMSSSISLTLVNKTFDVKQATELGAILLMDKPLIVLSIEGSTVPGHLRRAADVVIDNWDPSNEASAKQLADAMREMGLTENTR